MEESDDGENNDEATPVASEVPLLLRLEEPSFVIYLKIQIVTGSTAKEIAVQACRATTNRFKPANSPFASCMILLIFLNAYYFCRRCRWCYRVSLGWIRGEGVAKRPKIIGDQICASRDLRLPQIQD